MTPTCKKGQQDAGCHTWIAAAADASRSTTVTRSATATISSSGGDAIVLARCRAPQT